jgi:predicted short-subunit dehydrogenase-like oxidoreductase (DUF2520 family)
MQLLQKGISIIGAGNLAWHLALVFHKSGVPVNYVISRTPEDALELAEKTNAKASGQIKDIPSDTDLILICVTDSAVKEIAGKVLNTSAPIVHTSGSLPINVLSDVTDNAGVFYPLQTFTKGIRAAQLEFPVCIEYTNNTVRDLLLHLGNLVSNTVVALNSEKRMHLHVGAVMVNNFTNHLITKVYDYLTAQEIDTDLLLPIIEETLQKIHTAPPSKVQTGPAARGNREIIKKHLALLENDKELHNIYSVFSKSILRYYSANEK